MKKEKIFSVIFGFFIGFFSGLIGVGGGEFRLPVLIYLLKLPFFQATSANLLIGLITVFSALFMRIFHFQSQLPLILIFIMSISSIIGSFCGCGIAGKYKEKNLKIFLAVFLFIVGIKIIIDAFIKEEFFERELWGFTDYFLSLFIGFFIGIISGLFGVAGGEFRIPAFMYVFGLSVKNAGTASLIVSLPTIIAGILKRNKMEHFSEDSKYIGIYMGISSIIGALTGSFSVEFIDVKILKIILGSILILAIVRMGIKDELNPSCKS